MRVSVHSVRDDEPALFKLVFGDSHGVLLTYLGPKGETLALASFSGRCPSAWLRDPETDEVDTCKPFLMQQIQLIKPQLVCSLGNWATQTLLQKKVGITKVRGRTFPLSDFVLFPLLHPAAALHQRGLLEPLREDFAKLRTYLEQAKADEGSAASPVDLHNSLGPPPRT